MELLAPVRDIAFDENIFHANGDGIDA